MLVVWTLAAVRAANPWPDDGAWVAFGPSATVETTGDAQGGPELVGDPVVQWQADANTVYVRIHVGPTDPDRDVGVLVSTDGVPADYEWSVLVQGPDDALVARENLSPQPGPAAVDWGAAVELGAAPTGETRAIDDGIVRTVDLQFSAQALGIDHTTVLHLTPVIAAAWPIGWSDIGGCDDAIPLACDDLTTVAAGPSRIDEDGDGLTEPQEVRRGTRSDDADSDDDGLTDGEEAEDGNDDGIIDALQCDRDGDGLADGTELGRAAAGPDTGSGCFVADADPSRTTDPNEADTDGGGLSDGAEDLDRDGRIDPFETDPQAADDDVDTDGDGIPDVTDDLFSPGPDTDSDGDGLLDADEGATDTDGDGTPDFADLDSDDDDVPDGIDDLADPDGDGRPSFRDADADDDGLPDGVDGIGDADGDGRPDFTESDADDDGIDDGIEGLADPDGDGLPNHRDEDSDDDTVPDAVDRYGDRDGDGLRNAEDLDADGDTIPDRTEYDRFTPDFDGDGRFDFLDFDSDNDGIPDRLEANRDDDCDGRPDWRDADPEDGDCQPPALDDPGQGGPADPPSRPPLEPSSGCTIAPPPALPLALWLMIAARRRRRP